MQSVNFTYVNKKISLKNETANTEIVEATRKLKGAATQFENKMHNGYGPGVDEATRLLAEIESFQSVLAEQKRQIELNRAKLKEVEYAEMILELL